MSETSTVADVLKACTRKQKEELFAAVARELLGAADSPVVSLRDEANRTVAYLLPAWDSTKEYGADYSPAFFLEMARRTATPANAVSWPEFQALLDSDDAVAPTK
jgi:hypothetical protein